MSWRHPEELTEILTTLTVDDLTNHAELGRLHYKAHHTPGHLKGAVEATLAGRPWEPPPPPTYHPDPLQRHLDLLYYERSAEAKLKAEFEEIRKAMQLELSQTQYCFEEIRQAMQLELSQTQYCLAEVRLQTDRELAIMRNSTSWRFTAPLRKIVARARSVFMT